MKTKLADQRIAHGQCPNCGKEAAPYRLCYECRSKIRITRAMKRGEKVGAFASEIRVDKKRYYSLSPDFNENRRRELIKWGTPFHLPESDLRGRARLRGVRVDVESTLLEVIKFLNRPCTIEEILGMWGNLRAQRSSPLAHDLGRLIKAEDKRARQTAKRIRDAQRSAQGKARGSDVSREI